MAGLDPAIYVVSLEILIGLKTWMPGASPGKGLERKIGVDRLHELLFDFSE